MSAKPKHARRLSLFGLGASQLLSSAGEDKSQPNTTAPITVSINGHGKHADEKTVPCDAQRAPIRRKLSKKRKPPQQKTQQIAPSSPPPPTSYSLSNTHLSVLSQSELSHETDVPYAGLRKPSLKRKTSMSVRAALSSIFIPKPSKKTVSGILDGLEGVAGGKVAERRKANGQRTTHHYESRSPSPPSPEIRPPSGLGQIASSVDLSTYVQDEYEASLLPCLSRSTSRAPSISLVVPTPLSDDTAGTPETKSISSRELFYQPSIKQPSAPSQTLKDVLDLSTPYVSLHTLSSLAITNREFLHSARASLYSNIDSDDIGGDEKRRQRILQTIATNSEIANMVKSIRWLCLHPPISSSTSSLNTKRSIPRRAPTVSLSSSPEEYVLPRVLTSVPNLEILVLQHPHKSILQAFLPAHHESHRSPSSSPVSSSSQLPPPMLSSLRSLTLSGRTTLSTTFGSVLARFLELHPGIRELNLPDVFCLPNVHSLSRHGSASSSTSTSPVSTPRHELIPPVPPLPPSYTALKDKDPSVLPMLPNLTRLNAPLTLATQLIPGRPVRVADIELSTSLYEGLRPSEVAHALSEATDNSARNGGLDAKTNWRAARHSRRFGTSLSPVPSPTSPLPSPGVGSEQETKTPNWKAARQARRAGLTYNNAGPSLRELRMRCTAKVDCRTIGRVLIALGKELGEVLEVLAIEWSGKETDLLTQLTLTLSRFISLKRLEISALADPEDDDDDDPAVSADNTSEHLQKSYADQEAKIETERNYVEQWSRMCESLSHIEFASGRIWRAS